METENSRDLEIVMANMRQEFQMFGEEMGPRNYPPHDCLPMELFDPDGVPLSAPVPGWFDLYRLDETIDPGASRWLQAVLRYSRANGSSVFGPVGRSLPRFKALEAWTTRLGDPSLDAVISRWLPARTTIPASAPPVPSDIRPDRTLAILRPDWSPRGDLLAIDHRLPGDKTLLEVGFRGRTWLGPDWTSGTTAGKASQARPTHRVQGVSADGVEWSYKAGSVQVTRSVVLLKGRSMALLGQQEDGRNGPSEIRINLAEGIEASMIAGSRSLLLTSGRGRPTARLIPLGLPDHDRATDLGSIAVEGGRVVVRQSGGGRRRWVSILLCWGKPPTGWKASTVAYRSKACPGDVAVASRVAWGLRDEGLVVYRSLDSAGLRSFLGHQTGSKFLVGSFTTSGDVRPLFKLEG